MKKLFLCFAAAGFICQLTAQTWTNSFTRYGDLFVVRLESAPFPHPDRAHGRQYHQEFYSAATNYSDNRVAFFVPKGFRAGATTDYVIHFHGWKHHIQSTLEEYQLIEQFSESGRNAILIVPQGPYDAPDSFGGKLEDTNGFRRFMAEVATTLQARGLITSPNPGNIILSGHSGGYQVISSMVTRGGLTGHVREVWLFDALYARDDRFLQWFKESANHRLIDIYTLHGGTKEESEGLMKKLAAEQPPTPFLAKNESDISPADLSGNHLIFIYSPLEHNQVIYAKGEFREYLKTSVLEPIRTFASPRSTGQ